MFFAAIRCRVEAGRRRGRLAIKQPKTRWSSLGIFQSYLRTSISHVKRKRGIFVRRFSPWLREVEDVGWRAGVRGSTCDWQRSSVYGSGNLAYLRVEVHQVIVFGSGLSSRLLSLLSSPPHLVPPLSLHTLERAWR